MNKEQEIRELQNILGNSCLWKQSKDLDCFSCKYFSAENHVCYSFGLKEAELLYDAGYRKMDKVLKENHDLKHSCRVLERALNNALGIDHSYTNVYKEAEEELRREKKLDVN